MAGTSKYDWPPIEGLVAFVRKHGLTEAAGKLGVPAPTLRSHFVKHGIRAEEYTAKRTLADDALREIREMLDGA